jgi:hypothetical protein
MKASTTRTEYLKLLALPRETDTLFRLIPRLQNTIESFPNSLGDGRRF